jgi:hypothetical protein
MPPKTPPMTKPACSCCGVLLAQPTNTSEHSAATFKAEYLAISTAFQVILKLITSELSLRGAGSACLRKRMVDPIRRSIYPGKQVVENSQKSS